MIGMGTIVNTLAVMLGAVVGLFLKNGINKSMEATIKLAIGISTMFIGIGGTLSEMLTINKGKLEVNGLMLLIISMTIGTILGELIGIEEKLKSLGDRLKSILKIKADDTKFVNAFVTNTLIICVGAMAIVGSIKDGLQSDPSILYAKSILDAIISIILASTLGIGALFAAIPLFIYQGGITLFARTISGFLNDSLIQNISYIGSVLIFAIGLNMVIKKEIKVGNMLPALLIPIIYEVIINLF